MNPLLALAFWNNLVSSIFGIFKKNTLKLLKSGACNEQLWLDIFSERVGFKKFTIERVGFKKFTIWDQRVEVLDKIWRKIPDFLNEQKSDEVMGFDVTLWCITDMLLVPILMNHQIDIEHK